MLTQHRIAGFGGIGSAGAGLFTYGVPDLGTAILVSSDVQVAGGGEVA